MKQFFKQCWTDLKGSKTYIVAAATIIVGIYIKSPDLLALGLGLAGLRHGLSTEIAKIASAPDIKAEAIKVAPIITQELVQDATTPQAGDSAQLQQPIPPADP